jgi:hypothetical protein
MARFAGWQVGQRVARIDGDEMGTVIEVDQGVIKVKWDRGRTSYYRPKGPANVKLANHSCKKKRPQQRRS